MKKLFLLFFSFIAALAGAQASTISLDFNNNQWRYDESSSLYYQLGVPYAAKPAAASIEVLNIYVPAAYLSATANGDGTYTAQINKTGSVHGYTAATAPILFPLETPGYVRQVPLTTYSSQGIATFTNEGFIYVFAGMRGRENGLNTDGSPAYDGGAPWGITDLKAAVRYVRYNSASLPGDTQEIYTAGMSGGGAQSALMGATGDSALYKPYLESIGALMTDRNGTLLSDSINGSMDWCPITNLDYADEAYEWNMGQFSTTGVRTATSWKSALSKDMAQSWADYFNKLGLVAPDGTKLTLEKSADGIYQAGTYYDYLKKIVENSLNNFLSDTSFPYTVTKQAFNPAADFFGGGENMMVMMKAPGASGGPQGAVQGGGAGSTQTDIGTTYKTPAAYIAALNTKGTWVVYNKQTNTVKINSLKDFVIRLKQATKGIGAFDDAGLTQAENQLFGTATSDAAHFDTTIASLLKENAAAYGTYKDWDPSFVSAYDKDLATKDSLGSTSITRQNMYNPLYYLCSSYPGYNSSTVAKHWRIRTGIEQSDTALSTEVNLYLALSADKNVSDIDFATVWNKQHTMAERTGTSMGNLITWIHQCVAADHKSHTDKLQMNTLSIEQLTKIAQNGDAQAMAFLGEKYQQAGISGMSDDEAVENAIYWWDLAGKNGNARGYTDLGLLYLHTAIPNGSSIWGKVPLDEAKGLHYLMEATDNGDMKAPRHIGMLFAQGTSTIQKDEKKAAAYYRIAEERGDSTGTMYYADCLLSGTGVQKDVSEAIKLYQKIVDEKNHDIATCAFKLGMLYEKGTVVPQDKNKAASYYTIAADNGSEDGKAAAARLKK